MCFDYLFRDAHLLAWLQTSIEVRLFYETRVLKNRSARESVIVSSFIRHSLGVVGTLPPNSWRDLRRVGSAATLVNVWKSLLLENSSFGAVVQWQDRQYMGGFWEVSGSKINVFPTSCQWILNTFLSHCFSIPIPQRVNVLTMTLHISLSKHVGCGN